MTGSILSYLDGYCERAGDGAIFAEPLNAVTNLFFIVAAVMAARALLQCARDRHPELGSGSISAATIAQTRDAMDSRLRGNDRMMDLWLLIAALFSIGIGSGLWHLHPTGTTVLMDVIPITLFINIYLLSAMRRLFMFGWRRTLCWFGLYWMMTVAAQIYLPPDLLHGTIMYIPTYVAMVAITYGISRRDWALGKIFALVTTVWSASLILRTVDLEICQAFPIGTHFLWHTLNAWVLWRLLMVLLERGDR
ncbi:MAG: hypothetical protein ACKVOE_04830 [Rickettsiales bacterium]